MLTTIGRLLPREPYGNIAVLSDDETIHGALEEYVCGREGKLFDLSQLNLRRLPYGGEFFDAFVVDDDSFFTQTKAYKSLEKALQKNRLLLVVTNTLSKEYIESELASFGFTDFSTIPSSEKDIIVAKKWFRL